jgi:hypothetical protein
MDRLMTESGSFVNIGVIYNRLMDSSSVTRSFYRNRSAAESNVQGIIQGLEFSTTPTTMDGAGSFGRHMQTGVNKQTTDGSPSSPSLQLDYPGSMWRFRWVVKAGNRSISVLAKQNSTGSYRPSIIVKANSNVGINFDLSASAAAGGDWTKIGPISFNVSGSDVVWVELHNNNYGVPNMNGSLASYPAYFDHIVAT